MTVIHNLNLQKFLAESKKTKKNIYDIDMHKLYF